MGIRVYNYSLTTAQSEITAPAALDIGAYGISISGGTKSYYAHESGGDEAPIVANSQGVAFKTRVAKGETICWARTDSGTDTLCLTVAN